jgi:hypothetical protein
MLEDHKERLAWAIDMVSTFSDRKGFPQNRRALRLFGEGLLEIIGPVQEKRLPAEGGGEQVVCESRTLEQQGERLIAEAFKSMIWCPSLIQMRKIYERSYTCADGLGSSEMVVDEE